MKLELNKKLLLEDYMQYMMDHWTNDPEANDKVFEKVKNAGTPINHYIQNERILGKDPEVQDAPFPPIRPPVDPDHPENNIISNRFPYFDNDSVEIIRKGINGDVGSINQPFRTSHVSLEQGVQNAHDWQVRLGQIENSGFTGGKNIPTDGVKQTSATGLYQFTKDTATTDLKRGLRDGILHQETMPWVQQASNGLTYNSPSSKFNIDVSNLNRQEMTNLSLAHQIGHGSGKYYFHNIPEGNTDAQLKQNYYKMHHTNPDTQTIQNATSVFKTPVQNIHIRPENESNYNYIKYLASK